MQKIRPIFKWAGGKYNCVETILTALPNGKRLIEPFTGAATIFFNSNYARYLLAEKNRDLNAFYCTLRDQQGSFIDYCEKYFHTKTNTADVYYQFRDDFNRCRTKKKRAALFLYLNRHGYNGLCRYNQAGQYNVPFGHHKSVKFPKESLVTFMSRAVDLQLVHADFKKTFSYATEGDVIYCDPPYVPVQDNQKGFNYCKDGFSLQDQTDLAALALRYRDKGIPVIISNHDTVFTRQLYNKATIVSFPVKRLISCVGNKRQPVHELLAIFAP